MGKFTIVRSIAAGGLIAAVMTPTSVSAQQEVVAQADMSAMAQAMTICALDTTRFVSLENLNDSSGINPIRPYDSIKDLGGPFTIIPQDGFFLPRKDLTLGPNEWRGPYVSYQLARTQTGTTPYDQGSAIDPWDSPYYLFNPFGLIRGDQGIITLELYGDQFDRYTIVSLGPDGVMSSDDIAREFGPGVTSTKLTSLRGTSVTLTSPPVSGSPTYDVEAGTTLTLRGMNFGSPGENKKVLFGSTVLDEILSWTNREVIVVLPFELTGTDNFTLMIGSNNTNFITATITGGHTRVGNWIDYRSDLSD